jgi:hypothetical protein
MSSVCGLTPRPKSERLRSPGWWSNGRTRLSSRRGCRKGGHSLISNAVLVARSHRSN